MNRETPEFDPVGLFVVATAGGAPCSGYTHFFYIGCKVNTSYIYLQQYSLEVLLGYEESTEVLIWVHLWECAVCSRDKKQK